MEKKDSTMVILGAIAVIAIVILVLLFKQAITGQYTYQDKIRLVTEVQMPPTPGIQPDAPTIDDRFQKRVVYWIEGNRAYTRPGRQTGQEVPIQTYPIIYEQPAWAEYYIVEPVK